MAANFTDNWYVLKSRLCLFAPLRDNFEFLIDKSEAGGASLSAPENGAPLSKEIDTRFNTVWDSNKNDDAVGETPLDYRGSQVKALTFGEGGTKPNSEYNRRYLFNNPANTEMNRMMMTPHRTATINFWIRCINASSFRVTTGYPLYNFAVSSSIDRGVVIGADFATINYGEFQDHGTPAADLSKYILKMNELKYISDNPNVPSLAAPDSMQDFSGTTYKTPAGDGFSSEKGAGVWFMVTHVLSFGSNADEGIAIETHVRYRNENDNYIHLVWKQTNMNGTLWEGDGSTGVWGIGLPGDYENAITNDNQIAIRNLMIYEARIDDTQQRRIFDNGIDPFQADLESTYDFDQHDRNYWGSYGILGTRSNLRIEKSIFTTGGVVLTSSDTGTGTLVDTDGLPFRQWAESDADADKGGIPSIESYRREHIALRDNSALVMIGEQRPDGDGIAEKDGTQNFYSTKWKDFAIDLLGSFDGTISREPYSTEVTNRYIFPVKNKEGKYINYFTDRPSIISWRNSRVAGTRSTDPYRIWLSEGSTFNGFSDAILISDMAHPEDLPSGTYVASLNYDPEDDAYLSEDPAESSAATTAKGYPKHIGLLKFQYEAGSINYSNSFTYNGNGGKTIQTSSPIFWERQPRFIIMEWDAASRSGANYGGPVQFDALAWKPIAWRYVVYEIQESSKLSDRENLNAGKYQGKILMHLFGDPITSGSSNPVVFETNRYRYKATYEKPYIRAYNNKVGSTKKERDYGGWNFVSFEPDNNLEDDGASNTSKQFANRIYLPRVTIPHIKIPVLRPKLTVIKKSQSETFTSAIPDSAVGSGGDLRQRKLFLAGNVVYYEQRTASRSTFQMSSLTDISSAQIADDSGSIQLYHEGNTSINGSGNRYFAPISSGWYEVSSVYFGECGDHNFTFGISFFTSADNYAKKLYSFAGRLGDYVSSDSQGGAPSTGVITKVIWLDGPDPTGKPTIYNIVHGLDGGRLGMDTRWPNGTQHNVIIRLVSPSASSFSQIVSEVKLDFTIAPSGNEEGATGGETPERFAKYITEENGEQWINLFNVEGLYSRFNKNATNGARLVTNAEATSAVQPIGAAEVSDFWKNSSPYQDDRESTDTTRSREY